MASAAGVAVAIFHASHRSQPPPSTCIARWSQGKAAKGRPSPSAITTIIAGKPKVMPSMCGITRRTPTCAAPAAIISTFGPGMTEIASAKMMMPRT